MNVVGGTEFEGVSADTPSVKKTQVRANARRQAVGEVKMSAPFSLERRFSELKHGGAAGSTPHCYQHVRRALERHGFCRPRRSSFRIRNEIMVNVICRSILWIAKRQTPARRRPPQALAVPKKNSFNFNMPPKAPFRIFTHRHTSNTVCAVCNRSPWGISCSPRNASLAPSALPQPRTANPSQVSPNRRGRRVSIHSACRAAEGPQQDRGNARRDYLARDIESEIAELIRAL